MTAEDLAKNAGFDLEVANSMGDNQYLQTSAKLAHFVNSIQGPADLAMLQLESGPAKGWHGRRITDLDGDGVEDNVNMTSDQLDDFYDPLVFGVAEDINNTRHGNLPGHINAWRIPTEPTWHKQDNVNEGWKIK